MLSVVRYKFANRGLAKVLMHYSIYQMGCRKDIKCEAFPSILLLFRIEFNKFNDTGAQLSYDTKFTLKSCFKREKFKILSFMHMLLLSLLSELGKRHKMRGLKEFNRFNNTGA